MVIFGLDTLVGDQGTRVLSEINTLNVGGLWEIDCHSSPGATARAAELLWRYVGEKLA